MALLVVAVASPVLAQPAPPTAEEVFRREFMGAYTDPAVRAAVEPWVDLLMPAVVLPAEPPAPGMESANLVFAPTPEGEVVPDYAVGTVAWRFIDNGPTSAVDAVITFPDLVLHFWFKVGVPGANFPVYEFSYAFVGDGFGDARLAQVQTGGRLVLDHRPFELGQYFQDMEGFLAAEAVSLVFALSENGPHEEATVSFLFGDTGRAAFAAALAAWATARP